MKYIALIATSIFVTLVLSVNGYYNIVTLDIEKIKHHVEEINFILEEYIDNKSYVVENKKDYIERLNKIKSGIRKSKTSFFINKYKTYKVRAIDNIIQSIQNDASSDVYLKLVEKYNSLSQYEIKKLIKNPYSKSIL